MAFDIVLADDGNECFQDFDMGDLLLREDFVVIWLVVGQYLVVAFFIPLDYKLAAMDNDAQSDPFVVRLLHFDILAWVIFNFYCVVSIQIENNRAF